VQICAIEAQGSDEFTSSVKVLTNTNGWLTMIRHSSLASINQKRTVAEPPPGNLFPASEGTAVRQEDGSYEENR
jgi:hypothetical protein